MIEIHGAVVGLTQRQLMPPRHRPIVVVPGARFRGTVAVVSAASRRRRPPASAVAPSSMLIMCRGRRCRSVVIAVDKILLLSFLIERTSTARSNYLNINILLWYMFGGGSAIYRMGRPPNWPFSHGLPP